MYKGGSHDKNNLSLTVVSIKAKAIVQRPPNVIVQFFLGFLMDGSVSRSGNKTGFSSVAGSGFAAVINSSIF